MARSRDNLSCLRSAVVLLLLVSSVAPLSAQQMLADADWFERQIGAGVVWRHYLFDALFGSKQSVSYIEADLANPNVVVNFPYLEAGRQRTSVMVPGQFPNAKAGINGTYFATSGPGGHLTYLRINGTEIPPGGTLFSPWGYEGAVVINSLGNESIEQMPLTGWSSSSSLINPNILACGPLVMINGTVPTATLNAIGAHCTNRHPRSAVGITNTNKFILLTVDGRTDMSAGVTCDELGQIMLQLGCDDALNLDGGGSTTLWGAGELYSGVLNYPSDNGAYDHLGERACSNAISITSTAPSPSVWDARLTSKNFTQFMLTGTSQTVSLVYENIGTGTWTAADTKLVLARPDTRVSALYHPTWTSASQPAVISPASVAPGQSATFLFTLQAPNLATSALFDEHFMLTQTGVGRIGPADSEAWMRIGIQTPVPAGETFIVESRIGGQNVAWYSDLGMADTTINCTATSCTASIGSRFGSTFRSVAGFKRATVAPDFPEDAFYNVYVAWGAASNRRTPITYHVVRPGTANTLLIDQTATQNEWVQLGTQPYFFEKGYSASVQMTNENIDVSGNMMAGAVKFEYVPPQPPDKSYEVLYLAPAAAKPVINGTAGAGEWTAASPAGTGFVRHDNPNIVATENASFRMLFDDTYLYFLFQMTNAYLPAYAAPPISYGYSDLAGDSINFFLTPRGVNNQRFYRLVFSPNPNNGACYVWSQASIYKTTSATVGTDWEQRGGAAYSYAGNNLTIEYQIPWTEFDYLGIEIAASPGNGDVWGVQPCITNFLNASNSESVNWEPDPTGSFVFGEPFGNLEFTRQISTVADWSLY